MKSWLVNNVLMKGFGVNWKTNLSGWLLLICGGETAASTFDIAHLIPPAWQPKLMAICTVFTVFGLFSAKDNNVTNASAPVESKKMPAEEAA